MIPIEEINDLAGPLEWQSVSGRQVSQTRQNKTSQQVVLVT